MGSFYLNFSVHNIDYGKSISYLISENFHGFVRIESNGWHSIISPEINKLGEPKWNGVCKALSQLHDDLAIWCMVHDSDEFVFSAFYRDENLIQYSNDPTHFRESFSEDYLSLGVIRGALFEVFNIETKMAQFMNALFSREAVECAIKEDIHRNLIDICNLPNTVGFDHTYIDEIDQENLISF